MRYDELGERLKSEYEVPARVTLPANEVLVVRLDGRAFHTYTRGLEKPFDQRLRDDLTVVAEALAAEVSGCALVYSQSDELSLVLKPLAQPWFGGDTQKIASVTASLASAVMNYRRQDLYSPFALFDSRCFAIERREDVLRYLNWRHADATRNSVSAAAQAVFSHRELQGAGVSKMLSLLDEAGQAWEQHAPEHRYGVLTTPEVRIEDVEYVDKRTLQASVARDVARRYWVSAPASEVLPSRRTELSELIWSPER